jgi:hypothetical protein
MKRQLFRITLQQLGTMLICVMGYMSLDCIAAMAISDLRPVTLGLFIVLFLTVLSVGLSLILWRSIDDEYPRYAS